MEGPVNPLVERDDARVLEVRGRSYERGFLRRERVDWRLQDRTHRQARLVRALIVEENHERRRRRDVVRARGRRPGSRRGERSEEQSQRDDRKTAHDLSHPPFQFRAAISYRRHIDLPQPLRPIRTRTSFAATASPSRTRTSRTAPERGAGISFCIFIASRTTRGAPRRTVSPTFASTFTIRPGMGGRTSTAIASAPPRASSGSQVTRTSRGPPSIRTPPPKSSRMRRPPTSAVALVPSTA